MKFNNDLTQAGLEQIETLLENFVTSKYLDEVTQMRFLEESAQYFGVYVPNSQSEHDPKSIN